MVLFAKSRTYVEHIRNEAIKQNALQILMNIEYFKSVFKI